MKKILSVALALAMVTTTGFGNEQANKCEELKGNWSWNGSVNQWQCLDANLVLIDVSPKIQEVQAESNVTATPEQGRTFGQMAAKGIGIVATPVIWAGALITAIVIAPVWIVKKVLE